MNCYEIYFSPTGGTQKVAHILAKGMGTERAPVCAAAESLWLRLSRSPRQSSVRSGRRAEKGKGLRGKGSSGSRIWKQGH